MLIDRPQVTESSSIQNATVASGTADPSLPSIGELFYRTDLNAMRVYTGGAWVETGSTALAAHIADQTLHLTSFENTLLDGLVGTLTSTELNYVDGVTSSIQAQLNAITSVDATQNSNITALQTASSTTNTNLANHIADLTLHLTAAENTFLDALSLTAPAAQAAAVNFTFNLTSDAQAQFNTLTSNKFDKTGGTISGGVIINGTLDMSSHQLTGLITPVNANDAATKAYVDALQQGLSWKNAVVASTTVAGGNITLSGTQTIDGVSVVNGNRVLVKNQTDQTQNGIWVVSAAAWSRSTDADTSTELDGAATFVQNGTVHADTAWVQTNTAASIGSFTGSVIWSQFAAAGGATAGSGILISGSTISVRAGNGLTFGAPGANDLTINATSNFSVGSQLDLSNSGVAAGTYGSVSAVPAITTDAKGRITAAAAIINITGSNTPSTVVARDASGNFAANVITANSFAGNATTATTLQTARTIAISGGATGTATSFNGSANISINVTSLNAPSLSGIVPAANLAGTYNIDISGNASTATTASNANGVINNSGRSDSSSYPVLWSPPAGGGYVATFSCPNVTIQSSTGTLSASNLSTSTSVESFTPTDVFVSNGSDNNIRKVSLSTFSASVGDPGHAFNSTSGYQKFASGLIEQWVESSQSSVSIDVTVTYPIGFPSFSYVPQVTAYDASGENFPDQVLASVRSYSTSGCVVRVGVNGGGNRSYTLAVSARGY